MTSFISEIQFTIDQNQSENVEYVKYFGILITINPKYTRKIKSGIAMTKAAFKTRTPVSASKLDFNVKMKCVKCYLQSIAFDGAET